MSFLTSALARLKDMRVYWVCYSPQDIKPLKDKLNQLPPSNSHLQLADRLHVVVHHDIGLLLFELYQHIYHSLPPAGADYPAFWLVPPNSYRREGVQHRNQEPDSSPKEAEFDKAVDRVESLITERLRKRELPRAIIIDGKKGPSSVCSDVWDKLARSHHCIWLELDDFINSESVFIALLLEVASRVGRRLVGPVFPDFAERYAEEFSRYVKMSDRPFVVFINGRDGPGHSAGWESPDVPGAPVAQQPSSRWGADQIGEFWMSLRSLTSYKGSSGERDWLRHLVIPVMVRSDREFPVFEAPADILDEARTAGGYVNLEDCIPFSPEPILRKVSEWLLRRDQREDTIAHWTESVDEEQRVGLRERFANAMTLFRHSPHPAALCSWGLIKALERLSAKDDNDKERAKLGTEWLCELMKIGAIRDKPGGFAWMHRDIRDALRVLLEGLYPQLRGLRAECHQGIADWYMKLFRSSNDPLAALESLYHRLCCIEFADKSTVEDECGDPDHIKETALIEAITTLKLAQQWIISCGYFTTSSNLVRQIAQATGRIGKPRAAQFNEMCKETLRDFAREAADFRTAYRFNDNLSFEKRGLPTDNTTLASHSLPQSISVVFEKQFYEVLILTGLRSYQRAEDSFHDLFQRLGFPEVTPGRCLWKTYRVHDMRRMGRTWARSRKQEADVLKLGVHACERYMFLEMLIAQVTEYSAEADPPSTRSKMGHPIWTEYRRYSEAIYILATEIMRYIDDHDFLQVENAEFRTLYGVLLATLNRHQEAHRRLNEASGYLAHSSRRSDAVALAMIDLRRAETYLLQAEATSSERSKKCGPRSVAYLEDAHSCLSRAEVNLDLGQRKDVWWWTLMYELEMRICRSLAGSGLCACDSGNSSAGATFCQRNNCLTNRTRCSAALRDATRIILADPYRMARLTKIFLDIAYRLKNPRTHTKDAGETVNATTRFRSAEKYGRYPLDDRVLKYVDWVGAAERDYEQRHMGRSSD